MFCRTSPFFLYFPDLSCYQLAEDNLDNKAERLSALPENLGRKLMYLRAAYKLCFVASTFCIFPAYSTAEELGQHVFSSPAAGIQFSYPSVLREAPCPKENTSCVVCLVRTKENREASDCDLLIAVIPLGITEAARDIGWRKGEELGMPELDGWLKERWVAPGKGVPGPAEEISGKGGWKGLLAHNLASGTEPDGRRCSACVLVYTALLEGRPSQTIQLSYATVGEDPQFSREHTLDVVLKSLIFFPASLSKEAVREQ